jgi:erythromycin esterase
VITFRLLRLLLLANLGVGGLLFARPTGFSTQMDQAAVITWLRENAIPLRHLQAGHGFDDLQPLKVILKDARIVGLGEATHGTREFFQLKHRMLEFLVTEMKFNAFALESSYSGCQAINDYVLTGTGELEKVLPGRVEERLRTPGSPVISEAGVA